METKIISRQFYISNGRVAWQIPPDSIAFLYCIGAYQPPEGWEVVYKWDVREWLLGNCGELRRKVVKRRR
jgi:hypothetical protein